MSRQFIYDTLQTQPLSDIVGDRVHQRGSMTDAQSFKPFLVYALGNNTDEGMSDPDTFQPQRQFFQIFIHDEMGDYTQIDEITRLIRRAFDLAVLPDDLSGVQYLETSQDLDDPTLQTIMRYMRFQLARAR